MDTKWRGAARGDNRAIVASPGSARMPTLPHRLAMRPRFLLLPSPSGRRCRRWRRRRHRTCVHRRARWRASPVGNAKTHRTCVHRRARWRAPPWGTQRRTRHRRITTVSSTSSFHRRRRRLHRRCQAVGRGTTFGAGCAAQRAASAPSPPHLHSTRAHSAPSIRAAGTSWPDLGVRAQLLRSARASRRAAKGARRSIANREIIGSSSALRRAWSRPPQQGRMGARARGGRSAKKRKDAGRTN